VTTIVSSPSVPHDKTSRPSMTDRAHGPYSTLLSAPIRARTDGLIGADRAVIDKECVVPLCRQGAYAGKQPGGEGASSLSSLARVRFARLRVTSFVEEHHDAGCGYPASSARPTNTGLTASFEPAAARSSPPSRSASRLLIAVEPNIDRIERHERGQQVWPLVTRCPG